MTVELYSQDSIFNAGLTSVQAITQLIEPVFDTDVATKYYVDHKIDILESDPRFDPNIIPLTEVPPATDNTIGGIKVGANLAIGLDGTLSAIPPQMLPLSGGTITGGLTVLSAIVFPNGQIFRTTSAPAITSLPIATSATAGMVIAGEGLNINNNGKITVIPFNGLNLSGGEVFGDVTIHGILSSTDLRGTINNLPTANSVDFGCIKIGTNLYLDNENKLNAFAPYILVSATNETLGGVRIGNGIFVENGVISTSSVPTSGGTVHGDLHIDGALYANNVISPTNYNLPKASPSVLGGIKIGANLAIDANGVLSTNAPYTLVSATSSTLGGIKVGEPLTVDASGRLTITPATSNTPGTVLLGDEFITDINNKLKLSNIYLNVSGGVIQHNLTILGTLSATTIAGVLTAVPIATTEQIGGVKIGSGLYVDEDGLLTLNSGGLPGGTGIGDLSGYIPLSGGCSITGIISGSNNAKFLFENNSLSAVTTFAGSMLNQAGSANGFQIEAAFTHPTHMTKDLSGNIFVTDTLRHAIRKITPQGQVTTIAGGNGIGSTNGLGSAARFCNPSGIVIDSNNNLYVADTANGMIRKLTKDSNDVYTVSTLAGGILRGLLDGTGSAAKFQYPTGMTIDTNNNIFVVDLKSATGSTTVGNVIRKVTTGGVVTTIAGGGADLSATTTALNCRLGYNTALTSRLTIDSQNNLIYGDLYRVLKIAQSGAVTTIAGGNTGVSHYPPYTWYEGNVELGTLTSLPLIMSVFIDVNDNDTLYISSSGYLKQITKTNNPNVVYYKNILTTRGTCTSDTLINDVRAGSITCILKDHNNNITYVDNTFNKICKIVYSRSLFSSQEGIVTPLLRVGKIYGDGSGLANLYPDTGGVLSGPLITTSVCSFGGVNITDSYANTNIAIGVSEETGLGNISITGKYIGDGSGLTNVLQISGGVIEGNLSLTGKLSARGDIVTDGDIVAFASSDQNLKENIYNIPDSLQKISQLNGVYFTWKENAKLDVGVIAQQVEQVLPEIVCTRDTGYKAVQYDKLIPLLIESIKELKFEVETLKNQLKDR
jgi:hypothetical protein